MTDEDIVRAGKRKIYVIFTYTIIPIGGTQMYTAGKARYLENLGWEVYVFFSGPREGKSDIPSLTKYISQGGGLNFLVKEPYMLKSYEQQYCLNLMLERLKISNLNECEIIVESHEDKLAYWAEIFAAVIGARHFFIACNETYRSTPEAPNKTYDDNLDFFYFKRQRNELFAEGKTYKKLFNGYKNITGPLVEMPSVMIREMDAIQDVDFPIEKILKYDWNICHIGRAAKSYVPYVIEGVGELARRHPDKKINFICVGNMNSRMDILQKTFRGIENIYFTPLGDQVPIPRILFSKVDVVCAISKTSEFTANEDVLTIVGSADIPERTPGVLGYDTEDQVHGEGTFSYVEALENVLVKKIYDGKKFSRSKLRPAEEYYDKFWTIVKNAAPNKEYYVRRLVQERIRDWTAIFPFGMVARGARIILFGATVIAKDYKRQIQAQSNAKIEFGNGYVKHMSTPPPPCGLIAKWSLLSTNSLKNLTTK